MVDVQVVESAGNDSDGKGNCWTSFCKLAATLGDEHVRYRGAVFSKQRTCLALLLAVKELLSQDERLVIHCNTQRQFIGILLGRRRFSSHLTILFRYHHSILPPSKLTLQSLSPPTAMHTSELHLLFVNLLHYHLHRYAIPISMDAFHRFKNVVHTNSLQIQARIAGHPFRLVRHHFALTWRQLGTHSPSLRSLPASPAHQAALFSPSLHLQQLQRLPKPRIPAFRASNALPAPATDRKPRF